MVNTIQVQDNFQIQSLIYLMCLMLTDISLCEHSAHSPSPGEQRHWFWDGGLPEGFQSSQKAGYDQYVNIIS